MNERDDEIGISQLKSMMERSWVELQGMYQDAMNDMLKVGIENRRLEKQNEELEKRVESLQQGALHAENRRLRVELRIMQAMRARIEIAIKESDEI